MTERSIEERTESCFFFAAPFSFLFLIDCRSSMASVMQQRIPKRTADVAPPGQRLIHRVRVRVREKQPKEVEWK